MSKTIRDLDNILSRLDPDGSKRKNLDGISTSEILTKASASLGMDSIVEDNRSSAVLLEIAEGIHNGTVINGECAQMGTVEAEDCDNRSHIETEKPIHSSSMGM